MKEDKTELATRNSQPADNDLPQIKQVVRAEQERHRAIITQLTEIWEHRTEQCKDAKRYRQSASICRYDRNSRRTAVENNTARVILSSESPFVFLWCFSFHRLHDIVVGTLFRNPTELRPYRQRPEIPLYQIEKRSNIPSHRRTGRTWTEPRQCENPADEIDVEEYEQTVKRKVQLEEQAGSKNEKLIN